MANDLDQWLEQLPAKIERKIVGAFRSAVDRHADHIRDAAPIGKTSKLQQSVRVTETDDPFLLLIEAGGAVTTKDYGRTARYAREVKIPAIDDPEGHAATQGIGRVNAGFGVTYDYAIAIEYGTRHAPAQPFFWNTHRAYASELQEDLESALAQALDEL